MSVQIAGYATSGLTFLLSLVLMIVCNFYDSPLPFAESEVTAGPMTSEASVSLSGMHSKASGAGISMETEAAIDSDSDCKVAGNVVNASLVIMLLCSGFAGFLFSTKPQGQMAKIGQGVAGFTSLFGLVAVIQHPANCLEGDATLASGWCSLFTSIYNLIFHFHVHVHVGTR